MKSDSTNIPRIFHDSNKQSYFTNKSPKAFRERFRGTGDVKHKNETNNRVVTRTTSVPNNINGGYDSFPPPYAQAVNNSKYFRTRSLSAVGKGNNDDPYLERGDSVKLFNTLPKLLQNQKSEPTVLASLGKTMEHYKKSLQVRCLMAVMAVSTYGMTRCSKSIYYRLKRQTVDSYYVAGTGGTLKLNLST